MRVALGVGLGLGMQDGGGVNLAPTTPVGLRALLASQPGADGGSVTLTKMYVAGTNQTNSGGKLVEWRCSIDNDSATAVVPVGGAGTGPTVDATTQEMTSFGGIAYIPAAAGLGRFGTARNYLALASYTDNQMAAFSVGPVRTNVAGTQANGFSFESGTGGNTSGAFNAKLFAFDNTGTQVAVSAGGTLQECRTETGASASALHLGGFGVLATRGVVVTHQGRDNRVTSRSDTAGGIDQKIATAASIQNMDRDIFFGPTDALLRGFSGRIRVFHVIDGELTGWHTKQIMDYHQRQSYASLIVEDTRDLVCLSGNSQMNQTTHANIVAGLTSARGVVYQNCSWDGATSEAADGLPYRLRFWERGLDHSKRNRVVQVVGEVENTGGTNASILAKEYAYADAFKYDPKCRVILATPIHEDAQTLGVGQKWGYVATDELANAVALGHCTRLIDRYGNVLCNNAHANGTNWIDAQHPQTGTPGVSGHGLTEATYIAGINAELAAA